MKTIDDNSIQKYISAIQARVDAVSDQDSRRIHGSALSYLELRRALGVLGVTLPIVLVVGGYLRGVDLQPNFSSYYHTKMRDILVGYMCAMGIFFYCYRGCDRWEEWTSRVACVSAIGIGICPLDSTNELLAQSTFMGWLHVAAGAGFFLTAAIFSLFHFPRSEKGREHDGPWLLQSVTIYHLCGLVILVCCALMGIQVLFLPPIWNAWLNSFSSVLWLEWLSIWAFATAWLTKSHTLLVEITLDLARTTWLYTTAGKTSR